MYIVPKNQPFSPIRGWDIRGGGRNLPPHAKHNSQGVGMERVNTLDFMLTKFESFINISMFTEAKIFDFKLSLG